MGFCLLCNTPIAIEAAKEKFGIDRIAIVDWDLHHGNGPQAVYYDRDDVLTVSIHQDRGFPPGYHGADEIRTGKGEGYNTNIPMAIGSGNEAYLHCWDTIVSPALHAFKPELIIIASGLDANAVARLARMLVTTHEFRDLTHRAMADADALCDGRLALVHQGGYSAAYAPFCGQAMIEALTETGIIVEDPEGDFFLAQQPGQLDLAHQKTLLI